MSTVPTPSQLAPKDPQIPPTAPPMIAPGIAPTPPNHVPITVSTFAPKVEPDTPDKNTRVKLSSFHV